MKNYYIYILYMAGYLLATKAAEGGNPFSFLIWIPFTWVTVYIHLKILMIRYYRLIINRAQYQKLKMFCREVEQTAIWMLLGSEHTEAWKEGFYDALRFIENAVNEEYIRISNGRYQEPDILDTIVNKMIKDVDNLMVVKDEDFLNGRGETLKRVIHICKLRRMR